jgi:putative phosphoribosyl transferase
MYFASRVQAGRMLAAQLIHKYRGKKAVVMALSDGGVVVGAEIARELGCQLTMLLTSELKLPREPEALAGITLSGSLAYNSFYSKGEVDEMLSEYYGLLEQEKMTKMHEMNQLISHDQTITRESLAKHDVIVVSDGLKSGFPVDLAASFLKPIEMGKLVVAAPFASVPAVDRMHVLADDLYCLGVIHDMMEVDHYYDQPKMPSHDQIIELIRDVNKAEPAEKTA